MGLPPGSTLLVILHLLLCACGPDAPPAADPRDPCALMRTPAPGPRAEAVAAAGDDALEIGRLRVEEGHLTGDPGFYSMAEQAGLCALSRSPEQAEARRLLAHVAIQFHQFGEAEAQARRLVADPGAWRDHMLLGDALMEQGRLAEAAAAYQVAMDLRPGLELYDRAGWLRWLTGDLDGALELARLAAGAGSSMDPEPYAWALTRLGWLKALRGEAAPEIGLALELLPDYPPARLARGRIRLHAGAPGADEDLRQLAHTVEGARALAELDPRVDVGATCAQDARGCAFWLAQTDPRRALQLAEQELLERQDAMTHIAHAWAAHRSGMDATAEARDALATGILEPRALLLGGLILGDPARVEQALAMGPGLLPSERALARPEATAAPPALSEGP